MGHPSELLDVPRFGPSILIAAGNATTTGRAYAWDCAGPLISNCCNLIGTTDQPSIYLSHHCSYTADATDQAGDKRRSNRACFRWQRTVARPRQCRLAPRTPRSMRSRSAPSPWTGTTQLCPASGSTDQRGRPRPDGPACDVGSVEK
jgi:hypothetical protein